MKNRITLVLILILCSAFTIQAQKKGQSKFSVEDFVEQRNKFIKKEVGLTDQEAQNFIPLCNELMRKKYLLNKEVREQSRDIRKNTAATNADYEKIIDASLENKIKEAELEKEYYQKFKKILSAEKIYKFQRAEMKFMHDYLHSREKSQRNKR